MKRTSADPPEVRIRWVVLGFGGSSIQSPGIGILVDAGTITSLGYDLHTWRAPGSRRRFVLLGIHGRHSMPIPS